MSGVVLVLLRVIASSMVPSLSSGDRTSEGFPSLVRIKTLSLLEHAYHCDCWKRLSTVTNRRNNVGQESFCGEGGGGAVGENRAERHQDCPGQANPVLDHSLVFAFRWQIRCECIWRRLKSYRYSSFQGIRCRFCKISSYVLPHRTALMKGSC
jgi:hypothetical protein